MRVIVLKGMVVATANYIICLTGVAGENLLAVTYPL